MFNATRRHAATIRKLPSAQLDTRALASLTGLAHEYSRLCRLPLAIATLFGKARRLYGGAETRHSGVNFLGDDLGDTVINALSFTRTQGISYPSISDPSSSVVQQFSQAAPVRSSPTTAVIDKTGHVVGMILGRVSIGDLATLLHQAEAADS